VALYNKLTETESVGGLFIRHADEMKEISGDTLMFAVPPA